MDSFEAFARSLVGTWTTEKPTKPGWYWYRDKDIPTQPVYVYNAVGGLFVELWNGEIRSFESRSGRWKSMSGQWAGPIREPEEMP